MPCSILILAGGGGHTGYAYALAQALYARASLSFLSPEGDALGERRLSKFGHTDFLIKPRGPKTPAHEFAIRFGKAFKESLRKVTNNFDAVVSTGSNFCIPPAVVARVKGMPLISIESSVRFLRASKTARVLQPLSTITALQWQEQRRLLKGVVTGPLLPKPEVEPWNGGYILVTGGTYGHKLLFDILAESDLHRVVLQTGMIDPTPYMERHPEWKTVRLTERFHELLAGAEVVVTHFGSTVLEAVIYRKPTVLVPNPEWVRTAGVEDAKCLAKKVNAVLLSEINLEALLDAIDEARGRKVPLLPNGAENLANKILELLQGGYH